MGLRGAGRPAVFLPLARIEKDGRRTVLAGGPAFGEEIPLTSVAFCPYAAYDTVLPAGATV